MARISKREFDALHQDELERKRTHARRLRAGREAKKAGGDFEKALEVGHRIYRERGVASIERVAVPTNPAPRTWVHPQHQQKAGIIRMLTEPTGFDYHGTLGDWGREEGRWWGMTLLMEAKSSREARNRLPILPPSTKAKKRSGFGLKWRQIESTARLVRDFGAVGCVVWRNEGQRLALLPDRLLLAYDQARLGHIKSIPATWFDEYPVEDGPLGHFEDWLEPVRRYLRGVERAGETWPLHDYNLKDDGDAGERTA